MKDKKDKQCNVYWQEFNSTSHQKGGGGSQRISVSLKPLPLRISAKARDFVRSQNKEKWPLEDFQETHSFHDNNSSTQGTCGY